MLSIKIQIGWNKKHTEKKDESDLKKAALLAALVDSVVWIVDTVFLLKFFYAMPLYPFGMFFLFGVFLLYLTYIIIKTQLLTKKYGKKIYREEFGHTGVLLAAVSVALVFFLVVIPYA